MALQGSSVKPQIIIDPDGTPVTVNVGIVQSLTPSSATESITEKGLGAITKERLTQHSFEFGWEGVLTDYQVLEAGAVVSGTGIPPTLDVYMHTEKLNDAIVRSMTISGAEGEAVKYSLDGAFLSSTTGTAPTYDDPGAFFVYSDGTIAFGSETDEIKSFSITLSRSVEPIYGTSMAPTDFTIGTTEYSGQIELAASAMAQAMEGAWDPADPTFTATFEFEDPTDSGHTISLTCTGCLVNAADGSIDPESELTVTKSFKFESLTITGGHES